VISSLKLLLLCTCCAVAQGELHCLPGVLAAVVTLAVSPMAMSLTAPDLSSCPTHDVSWGPALSCWRAPSCRESSLQHMHQRRHRQCV
jgi:hypothetical protein